MNIIAIPRPVDRARPFILVGFMAALVAALAVELPQFEASKKCHRGAFSSAFSSAFEVNYCDVVVTKTDKEILRVRLRQ